MADDTNTDTIDASKYNDLQAKYNALQAKVTELVDKSNAYATQAAGYKSRLDEAQGIQDKFNALQAQHTEQQKAFDAEKAMMALGITDPDIMELIRMKHGKEAADKSLPDYIKELNKKPPVWLSAYTNMDKTNGVTDIDTNANDTEGAKDKKVLPGAGGAGTHTVAASDLTVDSIKAFTKEELEKYKDELNVLW